MSRVLTESMEAQTLQVVAARRGGPQVLIPRCQPIPKPGTGEVRVRMLAAGVAYADLMLREGLFPEPLPWPRVPGYDVVGEIEAVGPEVSTALVPGVRVAALTVHGSYARHRLLPARHCVPVPLSVDPAEAVALVLNYLAAWQMLHRLAGLRRGDRVAVYAAAGGVGTAVLELARLEGIRAIGLASAPKLETVRKLGAEAVESRKADVREQVHALCPGGVDAVLDPVGGAGARQAYGLLRPAGVLVSYGALSVARGGRVSLWAAAGSLLTAPRFSPLRLLTDGRGVLGYNAQLWRDHRPSAYVQDLSYLLDLLGAGRLSPLIAARIPLEDAAEAHRLLGEGRVSGKLVLV